MIVPILGSATKSKPTWGDARLGARCVSFDCVAAALAAPDGRGVSTSSLWAALLRCFANKALNGVIRYAHPTAGICPTNADDCSS